jgi:hypothetical protein
MTSLLRVLTDSQAGSFDRSKCDGLTLYCCEYLQLFRAVECEGMEFTLFVNGLWTVGLEDGLVLSFDGLEMR